jgi:YfiH family protein
MIRPIDWTSAPVLRINLGEGVKAAFTTRFGGVSAPPWDTMNLSLTVGDNPTDVVQNRQRLSGWLGSPVAYAHQVHGAAVAEVAEVVQSPAVDAFVTSTPKVGLAILVADCAPVLLADSVAGVIGAAHCGRSGLVAGVLQTTVAAMVRHGARQITAALGPVICGQCYEVPATMRDEVADLIPQVAATTSWGTPAIDLAAGVRAVLAQLEIPVTDPVGCTRTDSRFFSYRAAAGAPIGRTAGVIALS